MKPKSKRSNLLSSTTPERLEMINEKSELNGGLSNITIESIYGYTLEEIILINKAIMEFAGVSKNTLKHMD